MSWAMLRTLSLVLATLIAFSPATSFGRGPGGRGGGAGGARSRGGPGEHGRAAAKPSGKRKGKHNVGGQSGLGHAGRNDQFGGGQQFSGHLDQLGDQLQGLSAARDKMPRGAIGQDELQSSPQSTRHHGLADDTPRRTTAQDAKNELQNGSQPFSPQWYAEHPNAWHATHPHADAWAAATATGVAAWLGWATADITPAYGSSYNTTYVYEQAANETEADSADSSEDTEDTSSAADGDTDAWLSLGSYSVQSDSGEPTSRYFQLSTNRQGELRGVYYDEISGSSQNLSGTIDESTRVATWSLDSNRATIFRAQLSDLTAASGTVVVTQSSGQQRWRIAREPAST